MSYTPTMQHELFAELAVTPDQYNAQELVAYIEAKNAESQKEMDMNPGLWIGMLTTDVDHWAQQGIHTVEQYKFYMDYLAIFDFIADDTSKSYARYVLEGCKTCEELDDRYQSYRKGEFV